MQQYANIVDYSVIRQYFSTGPYRTFGVKYVVRGTEIYLANGKKYFVGNREYLLSNNFCEGHIEIDSKMPVIGICIDIRPEIISEVVAGYMRPDTAVYDLELDAFFNTRRFLENKYSAAETHLGKLLTELTCAIENHSVNVSTLKNDFYFTAAEKIIEDHIPVIKQLQQVKAVKYGTKKDLFRKLLAGKDYMLHGFHSSLTVAEVAAHCCLSEYHFFRLFKATFGISPHRFLIRQRLQAAGHLLKEGQSISDVAISSGFSDVYAFSKSFKKHFGYPPSLHR